MDFNSDRIIDKSIEELEMVQQSKTAGSFFIQKIIRESNIKDIKNFNEKFFGKFLKNAPISIVEGLL